ncbi:hypothetical protein ACWDBW_47085 [Streptomyces sp. NPDC001107]
MPEAHRAGGDHQQQRDLAVRGQEGHEAGADGLHQKAENHGLAGAQ